jgi:hypothetical protein
MMFDTAFLRDENAPEGLSHLVINLVDPRTTRGSPTDPALLCRRGHQTFTKSFHPCLFLIQSLCRNCSVDGWLDRQKGLGTLGVGSALTAL